MKLSYKEAKDRFASEGECKHDPDYFTTFGIPNCDTHMTQCRPCGKVIEKWYGTKGLEELIMEYLTESKTRTQIYFRFENYSPNTIRGRLADLKRKHKIFSIEQDVFTPVRTTEDLIAK